MNAFDPFNGRRIGLRRHASGLIGGVCGLAMVSAVMLAFWDASRTDWLTPSEDNLAAVRHCDEQAADLRARNRCVAMRAAQVKHGDGTPLVVAARPSATGRAR